MDPFELLLLLIALLAVLWLLFVLLPAVLIFFRVFGRKKKMKTAEDHYSESYYYRPFMEKTEKATAFLKALPQEKLSVLSPERGDGRGELLKLSGTLYGEGRDRLAVLMHGYSAEPMFCMSIWGEFLCKKGFSVLIPDQRASGLSEGSFCTLGIAEGRDTAAWADMLAEKYPSADILLCGLSMGGASVLYASDKLRSGKVRAIIADCPVTSPYDQMIRISRRMHIPLWLLAPLVCLTARVLTGENFRSESGAGLEKSGIPVFFISGTADSTVDWHGVEALYRRAPAGSRLRLVPDCEHGCAFRTGSEETLDDVSDFIEKYYGEIK